MKNCLLIVLFLFSTTCFAADTIELSIWYNVSSESEQALFEAQVQHFNEKMPNIQISTLVLPQSAFSVFVVKEAEAGRLPDILYFQSGSLSRYVWSGLLMPINQVLGEEFLENITPTIRQQSAYPIDGRVYALNPTSDALTLYANKQHLFDAGITVPSKTDQAWNTEQFHDVLEVLSKQYGKWPLDMQLHYADDDWYVTAFSPLIQATGGDIISKSKWDAHIAPESGSLRFLCR